MISIVIPTYKRAHLLKRLLLSIERQSFREFELIVVNDSSPNIEDYIETIEWARKVFSNFNYIYLKENRGAPYARNYGLSLSQCDWVALVDDDDEWLPMKLELQNDLSQKVSESVGIIYTWANSVDAEGRILFEHKPNVCGNAVSKIFKNNFIVSPTVLVRREYVLELGGFDVDLQSCQDWDMWARMFLKKYECTYVSKILANYYVDTQNSVGLSESSALGHKNFLKKHWKNIIKHSGLVSLTKFIYGVIRVRKRNHG